CQQHNSHPLTY
nr:immunoglobulin light chain junction region [Macaca mulatta]